MQSGDIVITMFPYATGKADKPHPALVLDVQGDLLILAYGTSQHLDAANPLADEVMIVDHNDIASCGLDKATRFTLSNRAKMLQKSCTRIGALPTHKYKQLYRAAVHCGLV